MVAAAVEKMIAFYDGDLHDINHFLKVWAFAQTIGEREGLDAHTPETLELTAVVHDIACPLCRQKYGDTDRKHQERESAPLVAAFFAEPLFAGVDVARISHIVSHHHTYTGANGIDDQLLPEADFVGSMPTRVGSRRRRSPPQRSAFSARLREASCFAACISAGSGMSLCREVKCHLSANCTV